jgi:hypothetical protein
MLVADDGDGGDVGGTAASLREGIDRAEGEPRQTLDLGHGGGADAGDELAHQIAHLPLRVAVDVEHVEIAARGHGADRVARDTAEACGEAGELRPIDRRCCSDT